MRCFPLKQLIYRKHTTECQSLTIVIECRVTLCLNEDEKVEVKRENASYLPIVCQLYTRTWSIIAENDILIKQLSNIKYLDNKINLKECNATKTIFHMSSALSGYT